jgi:hypothetical protein
MNEYKVLVDGQFFSTVASREGAEIIRDHWAGPNQVVEIVEVGA